LGRQVLKKVSKEEAMQIIQEGPKRSTKPQASEGTWFRITFTLDNEHYRKLWQRAEEEHRTIPDLVRESVTGFFEK
jgi:hypothetical protein